MQGMQGCFSARSPSSLLPCSRQESYRSTGRVTSGKVNAGPEAFVKETEKAQGEKIDPAQAAKGLNKYSRTITQPKKQGASQAMLYATGLGEDDMDKAQVDSTPLFELTCSV